MIPVSANQFLLSEKVAALPVNPCLLAEKHGVRLLSFDEFCEYYRTTPRQLEQKYNRDGFALVDGECRMILYRAALDAAQLRWVLMRELCMLLYSGRVEPLLPQTRQGRDRRRKAGPGAQELSRLAEEILCPLPIAHLCGVATAAELALLCGIPLDRAQERMLELRIARRKGGMFRLEEELELLAQFAPFISDYTAERLQKAEKLRRYRDADVDY